MSSLVVGRTSGQVPGTIHAGVVEVVIASPCCTVGGEDPGTIPGPGHIAGVTSLREIDSHRFLNAIESRMWTASWQSKDRKSTRLNSSHVKISYAVFCLKKK